MNDDLILRARLHEMGRDDEIVKILGQAPKGMRQGVGKIPIFGAAWQKRAIGEDRYNQMADEIKTQRQGQKIANVRLEAARQGYATSQGSPLMDQKQIDQLNADTDKLLEETGNMPQPQPEQSTQTPATDGSTGGSGLPVLQPAPRQTPKTQQPQQPQQTQGQTQTQQTQQPQGNAGLSEKVQDMAQQFQAGQDMQTIQQGKGAEKQTYMKNRSGLGKVADLLTFGATSQFGSTGGIARRKANQQSQQQTQRYNQAQQRMNQRSMGMQPIMTSFDRQLSAYEDIISIRKGIQEANTTRNLRR